MFSEFDQIIENTLFPVYVEMECPLSGRFEIFEADSWPEFYALLEEDGWEFLEYDEETGDEEADGYWAKVDEVDWDFVDEVDWDFVDECGL